MTVESPELISDRGINAEVVTDSAVLNASLEDSFLLVAQLGCLSALSESSELLSKKMDEAIRAELLSTVSLARSAGSASLWFGFERFATKLTANIGPSRRDALIVEFLLGRMSIQQVFDPNMNWRRLRSLADEQLQLTGEKFGGNQGFYSLLHESYRTQRNALAKELFFKSLPTLVLVVSSLIAIAMALLFTRSLTSAL